MQRSRTVADLVMLLVRVCDAIIGPDEQAAPAPTGAHPIEVAA